MGAVGGYGKEREGGGGWCGCSGWRALKTARAVGAGCREGCRG